MAKRSASSRHQTHRRPRTRRPARKGPASGGLGNLVATPFRWARRPARVALTATLVGYGLAEAAWQARPAFGSRASR